MKRVFGAVLILAGLLAMLVGVGWHIFSSDREAITKKMVSGDYTGALDAIQALRANTLFQASSLLPGIEEELGVSEAWALYRMGDKERAAKIFRQLADARNVALGASALFNAATIELSPENFDRAIRDYEEVLKKTPGHVSAQRNLEILRQIEEEQKKERGEGQDSKDGSGQDSKESEDGTKKGTRTKDKLEYRDSEGGDQPGSPILRW